MAYRPPDDKQLPPPPPLSNTQAVPRQRPYSACNTKIGNATIYYNTELL